MSWQSSGLPLQASRQTSLARLLAELPEVAPPITAPTPADRPMHTNCGETLHPYPGWRKDLATWRLSAAAQRTVAELENDWDELPDDAKRAFMQEKLNEEDFLLLCAVSANFRRYCQSKELDGMWKRRLVQLTGSQRLRLARRPPKAACWFQAWEREANRQALLKSVLRQRATPSRRMTTHRTRDKT